DKTVVNNNLIMDVQWALGHAYGQQEDNAEFANNAGNVQLSWDINRPRPGPDRAQLFGVAPGSAPSSPTPVNVGSNENPAPTPPPSSPAPGEKNATTATTTPTFLSDLRWARAVNGWGPVQRNRSNGGKSATDGRVISIGGRRYKKGLGVAMN